MADYSLGSGFASNASLSDTFGVDLGTSGGGFGLNTGIGSGLTNPTNNIGYDFDTGFSDYGFSPQYTPDFGFTPSFSNNFGSSSYNIPTNLNQASSPSFWESDFGKFIKGAGKFALNMTPQGRALTTAYGVGKAMTSGQYGQALGGLVGAVSKNGLLGQAVGLGTDALMGKDVSGKAKTALGGNLGAFFGGQMAGPAGAYVGGNLGAYAVNQPGVPQQQQQMSTPELLAGTLGQLWLNNRAAGDAKDAANAMSPNAVNSQLNSLFGQDSSFAKELRQQLERRDAAAGRRSQYGPREVELQAKLASMQSDAYPRYMQANASSAQAQLVAAQQKQVRQAQMLSGLFNLGRETGVFRNLGGLFQNSPQFRTPGFVPEYNDMNYSPSQPSFGDDTYALA